jgi:transcriptional regulator with XRE-family HTH domain
MEPYGYHSHPICGFSVPLPWLYDPSDIGERRVAIAGFVGRRLRSLREARGLTQSQLARRARVHIKWLARIETGKRSNMTLEMLLRLAAGLRVEPAELLPPRARVKQLSAEAMSVIDLLKAADQPTRASAVQVVRAVVALGKRQ